MNARFALATAALLLAASPASSHSWYTGLHAPNGMSCCSDVMKECHPTEACVLPGGKSGIQTSKWGCQAIPPNALLKTPSPDGMDHICEGPVQSPSPVIYCVILGDGV